MTELYQIIYPWKPIFTASFAVTFVLIIWNETNAFVEYARLLGAKLEEYKIEEGLGISFPDYILSKYSSNFIVRLICCPICLCVWLSIVAFAWYDYGWGTYSSILDFFLIFYLSMAKYFSFKFLMKG